MNKIYLSAPFRDRSKMAALAHKLRYAGFEITSRWLTEPQHSLQDADLMDLEDIKRCDTFVRMADVGTSKMVDRGLLSGGRLVETGYAFALGKRCITVGFAQSVFDNLTVVLEDTTALVRFLNLSVQHA